MPILSGTANSEKEDTGCSYPVDEEEARGTTAEMLQQEITPLEATIKTLQQRVVNLKRRQNELSPVARLPDEVLTEIFMYLVYDGPGTDSESAKWIRATHVCSRWRRAAIQYPRLWCRPSFCSPECTAEMIRRAKAVPVSFEVRFQPESRASISLQKKASTIFKYLSSAQSLIIHDKDPEDEHLWEILDNSELLQLDLERPTPRLQCLTILSPYTTHSEFPIEFLSRICGSQPSLRHLHLENWSLFRVSNLSRLKATSSITYLEICLFTPYGPSFTQQTSVQRVVSCLNCLPQLEYLQLSGVFSALDSRPDMQGIALGPNNIAHLPVLDDLKLNDYPDRCSAFLKQLPHPPKRSLSIAVREEEDGRCDEGYMSLVQAVQELLADPILHAGIISKKMDNEDEDIDETCITVNLHTKLASELSPPVSIAVSRPTSSIAQFLQNLIEFLPLDELSVLSYAAPVSTSKIWESVGKLQKLQALSVRETHQSLFEFLSTVVHTECGEPYISFPALRYLKFCDWEFTSANDETGGQESEAMKSDAPFVESSSERISWLELARKLKLRHPWKNALVVVWLEDCKLDCKGISSWDVVKLNETLPNGLPFISMDLESLR